MYAKDETKGKRFLELAKSIALRIFLLSPEVEYEMKQSFSFASACNCLLKISSYPLSFDQAVINEVSVDRAIDGIGSLLLEVTNVPTYSADIC